MIDEKDVAERFHSAFDAQPSAGAAQRLRSAFLEAQGARPIKPRGMPHGIHLSLRIMAALALIAVVIAASATFLALHAAITKNVPANQTTTSHATARASWGMVSGMVGWEQSSWVDVNGLHHILRTTDAGAQWTDVSPPANIFAPEGKGSVFAVGGSATVYVLDSDHLWLGQIAPGAGFSQVTTLATADGGRRWKRGESLRASGPSSTSTCPGCASAGLILYFLDANHGWMLVQYFNPLSINVVPGEQNQLYQTTDGGMTWHEVAHVDATAAPGEQFVNSLCSWSDVAFESPDSGWLMQTCRGTSVGTDLLVTHDGGTTWSALGLPPPANAHGAFPPVVFDRMHTMVEISLLDQYYVLVTADGGLTWTRRDLPTQGITVLDFLDPRHGWVVNGVGELYRTTDGGLTWSRIRTSIPFSQSTPEDDLYFVDPRSGFAMVATPADESKSELWKTSDAGQTWSLVGLMPPPMPCPPGCTAGNRT